MAPGFQHQAIVDLLRSRPDLLLVLSQMNSAALLDDEVTLSVLEGNLDVVTPPQFDADLVVIARRGEEPVLAAVLEAQLSVDPDKLFSWPVYAAVARSRHRCPAVVIVLCVDREVARWAEQAVLLGPGSLFRCVVVGPDAIPRVLERADARNTPELGVLSAIAHARSEDALAIALATIETFDLLDADRSRLYYDLICQALPEATRRALERIMIKVDLNQYDTPAVRHWMDKGRQEGRQEGRRELLLEAALRMSAKGMEPPQIAEVLGTSVEEVQQLIASRG